MTSYGVFGTDTISETVLRPVVRWPGKHHGDSGYESDEGGADFEQIESPKLPMTDARRKIGWFVDGW